MPIRYESDLAGTLNPSFSVGTGTLLDAGLTLPTQLANPGGATTFWVDNGGSPRFGAAALSTGEASLTATYIGFGNGSNFLTGSPTLTYTVASQIVTLGDGTTFPTLAINKGAAFGSFMQWQDAGTRRWEVQHTSGNGWALSRFDNLGVSVDTPMQFSASGFTFFSQVTAFTNATASTSTTTGALVVTGGVGISGALYVGGAGSFGGNIIASAAGGMVFQTSGRTDPAIEVKGSVGSTFLTIYSPNVNYTAFATATRYVFGSLTEVNPSYTLQVDGSIYANGDIVGAGDLDLGSTGAVHLGDPSVDGTWKMVRSGNDLLMQRREGGSYVTKLLIAA